MRVFNVKINIAIGRFSSWFAIFSYVTDDYKVSSLIRQIDVT